jgi:uncharacterized protein YbjT (DUF2867 family)
MSSTSNGTPRTTLVTGATGNVGSAVVHELTGRGLPARAFVRDADRAAGRLGPGVDLAVGDLADPASVARAMDGADRLFLACGNVPGQVEMECAAIDAARAAGVSLVVKLSSPAPAEDSALVFDRWHAVIEAHLRGSGVPWVLLRPSTYMTNLLAFADAIAHTGSLFAPAGDAKVGFVDPRDVGAAAAAVLAQQDHDQRLYTLTGPAALTYADVAADLTEATGRPLQYVDVPEQAARQGMLDQGLPEPMADAILGAFQVQRSGVLAHCTDDVRALTGRPPRSFAVFAEDYAAAFLPASPAAQAS